jgi:hypothetical protein
VQRQLSYLAELTSDVRHMPGKASVIADALSCLPPLTMANVKKPLRQPESSLSSLPASSTESAVAVRVASVTTAEPAFSSSTGGVVLSLTVAAQLE